MQEITYRKLSELNKLDNNPRLIKKKQLDKLCKSIQENPEYFNARPLILSDRTGKLVIIAGNMRYEASKKIGLETVPTILIPNLTAEKEKEIVVRDNVNNGEWDWDLLLSDWDAGELDEWGVDTPKKDPGKDEFEKRLNNITDETAVYPIIPKYDEKHEMFIIVSSSEIDSNWLRERLGMQKMKSYKTGKVVKANIISVEDVKNVL